jgi:integrase
VLGLQRGEPLLRQLLGTLLDQLVDPVPGHEQAPLRQMLKDRLGFLSTDVAGDREPTRERVQHLADRSLAWTAAKLTPIGLHECRHTCASIFIAAGVNAKALSSYLGHSSITITLDRYGHLMPAPKTRRSRSSTPTSSARLAQKLAHPARRRLRYAVCSSS